MFLPKTQEYAIRCMAHIALLPWEVSVNAKKLSSIAGIPQGYLPKVLQKLTAAGLLIGEKGHHGGFRLAQPPSKISYLEILKATGYTMDPEQCISGRGKCRSKNPCPLHHSFSRLNRALFTWAKETTLDDVLKAEGSRYN